MSLHKNIQEYIGTAIGGITGFITSSIFTSWIQPLIISGLCALVGLLITHYGKKILKKYNL